MTTYNVLFIAPEIAGLPKLAVWDEVYQLEDISNVHVEKLMGPGVDRRRLQSILDRVVMVHKLTGLDVDRKHLQEAIDKPYDIIIWAGHGQAGRLLLSVGWITPRAFANSLRKSPPHAIIVSTCFSAARDEKVMSSIAECLAGAGIDTIAMSTEIEDTAAMIYDVEFVRCTATGSEFDEAHESALEALRSLNGDGASIAPMQFYGKKLHEKSDSEVELSEQLAGINNRLDTILQLVKDTQDVTTIQQQMINYLRDSQQAILQVVQTISKVQTAK